MRWSASLIILFFCCGVVCADADYSTPAAAFRTYSQALFAGDTTAIKSAAIVSEKYPRLLGGMVEYIRVEKQFRTSAMKAFPEAAKDLPDPAEEAIKSITSATVKIDNDSAVLITHQSVEPVKLKRVDGKWKVDLAGMYNEDSINDIILFRGALTGVMSDIAAEIDAGKYKSFVDVRSALEIKVKMRIAMREEDWPTTRPVNP